MKLACWNVNSIRSRLAQVVGWIEQYSPDILLMQELKCEEEVFPYEAFSHLSYNYSIIGQKTYNGVAIFSKYPIDNIKKDFDGNPCSNQARFIEVTFQGPIGYCRVASIYVPNGGEVHSDKFELKLNFLQNLGQYLHGIKTTDENVIIAGDFNVAPYDLDVYAPQHLQHTTCFTVEERVLLRSIMNDDWIDLYRILSPKTSEYTWWDYRAKSFEHNQGMRIDLILGNPQVADKVKEFFIDKDTRAMEKASDHAPIMIVV